MVLTDTHCHLNWDSYDTDRSVVVERAAEAGVALILNPGIDIPSSKAAIHLAEEHPIVYAAVGVHPNSASTWEAGTLAELRDLAQHPKVLAIGEIGLDYYRDRAPRYVQEQVLHYQLELASELSLPVIIHNREATDDVVRKLVDWQKQLLEANSTLAKRPGVLHSYSGNISQSQTALEANFYLGVTGPVTFKKADDLRQVVQQIPMDRLLIETDAPFLTPHPYRGKRNEPAHVQYTAQKVAELHSLTEDDVADRTTENAARLFRWKV
ncbi:MAG: TatD family deoxyribonuclease [Chloroflexi bacterium]|nr:MAG: TatD family deoxyribonuclease [Chloroflexota bacterium]MBL1196024.1 TatD family deoxyribonuclease [Chloroflexota bacterium]NOH13318.1 TatD family hydrolase [Chloroflexota bacterium]